MKYLVLIIALITIGFTSLVSIPGSPYLIGGMTQADISNMFPSAITPAGITFAIWSIIYLSWILAGLALSGLPVTPLTKRYFPKITPYLTDTETSKKAIVAFATAISLTGFWLIPWGNIYIGMALIVMFVILGFLKYAFHLTRKSSWLVRSSVELTLGWINIATVANITIWLMYMGFTGGGISETYWAIGVLGLALLLTSYYQCRYHTYIISLVFLWTMIGEWIAHPVLEQRVAVAIYSLVIIINMIISLKKRK
ncbi:hypothetical protein HOO68_00550 [Candidatus Gracilibacteria bacterium]|nr:hypothetical protein [Candidatus Gracilibacteria bacterium]